MNNINNMAEADLKQKYKTEPTLKKLLNIYTMNIIFKNIIF